MSEPYTDADGKYVDPDRRFWNEAEELKQRRDFMQRQGYRRCSIMACNCGLWHGGNASDRLREISALVPHNGERLIDAIRKLLPSEDQ